MIEAVDNSPFTKKTGALKQKMNDHSAEALSRYLLGGSLYLPISGKVKFVFIEKSQYAIGLVVIT